MYANPSVRVVIERPQKAVASVTSEVIEEGEGEEEAVAAVAPVVDAHLQVPGLTISFSAALFLLLALRWVNTDASAVLSRRYTNSRLFPTHGSQGAKVSRPLLGDGRKSNHAS